MLEYLRLLLTVVLGNGIVITIAELISQHGKDKRARSEAVKYLALQLAFQFEGFTITCAQGISDHQFAIEHEGHAGAFLAKVPDPPEPPAGDSYRFMDPQILNRVFGFSQRCKMAQLAADFWMDAVGEIDCYRNALEENTLSTGSEALDIARDIRARYQIGQRSLVFGKWNIDDFIREEMQKLKKWVEERERVALSHAARTENDPGMHT